MPITYPRWHWDIKGTVFSFFLIKSLSRTRRHSGRDASDAFHYGREATSLESMHAYSQGNWQSGITIFSVLTFFPLPSTVVFLLFTRRGCWEKVAAFSPGQEFIANSKRNEARFIRRLEQRYRNLINRRHPTSKSENPGIRKRYFYEYVVASSSVVTFVERKHSFRFAHLPQMDWFFFTNSIAMLSRI